ncbi:polyprenyl synthetase family protein [Streptomyces sp. NPDC001941]|uniref:polyprenyl synthetase family protein n=1 Tax=Streptomyces sp. NPDC001941 TaxID=3154659 RepID=UPI003320D403
MTATTFVTEPPDLTAVAAQVDSVLSDFLASQAGSAAAHHLPAEITEVLGAFLFAGGKRLRPLLCVTGWQAVGGHGDIAPVLQVAASLEMFHAFALIHDDIMDDSATRRGRPSVHRALAARHQQGRSTGAADRLGAGAAILIGDLALTWADELLHTAGLTAGRLTSILPLLDVMRTEVMYGQYLDLLATGRPTPDLDQALAVIRYKTAKYTVERPLHIGAALAGARPELLAELSDFALPLGEAFQLRDDLLGVYGNPLQTGKPRLDDLRDGKHTVLLALALTHATRAQADQLRLLIGCADLTEDQAEAAQRIVTATGARDTVEAMITERLGQALAALRTMSLAPDATNLLRHLAESALTRDT